MDAVWQDIRYALRTLGRSPGFTIVGILVLALAIGVNTAIFSLVNALIFVKPPVPNAGELRFIYAADPNAPRNSPLPAMRREFEVLKQTDTALASLFTYSGDATNILIGGELLSLSGERVTGNYFETLGVAPQLGRALTAKDDEVGAEPVVVISDAFWKSHFAGDPAIIGKTLNLDQRGSSFSGLLRAYTIVGVAPASFKGLASPFRPTAYWAPHTLRTLDFWQARTYESPDDPYRPADPLGTAFVAMAFRKPDAASDAHIDTVVKTASYRFAAERRREEHAWTLQVQKSKRNRLPFDNAGRIVPTRLAAALMFTAGAVLLIALANLGGLLSARSITRRSEMSIRTTLGATGWRLTRQLLIESLMIACAGAVAGLLVARILINGLVAAVPRISAGTSTPFMVDIPIDWRVLAFTALTGIAAALLVSLAPARHATARDLLSGLSDGLGSSTSRGRSRLRRAALLPQVCGSLVLLVVAGLLIKGVLKEEMTDPGYSADGVVLVDYQHAPFFYYRATPEERKQWRAQRPVAQARLLAQLREIPGVDAIALTMAWPNGVPLPVLGGTVIDRDTFTSKPVPHGTALSYVTPGYFEALRIPIKFGRPFNDGDRAGSPKVAVVCEGLAWRLWGTPNAVGRYIAQHYEGSTRPPEWLQVVGVVSSVALPLTEGARTSTAYIPAAQGSPGLNTIVARGNSEPSLLMARIKEAVIKTDQTNLTARPRMMTDSIQAMLFPRRAAAAILGTTGIAGLILACIGLYGVVSYSVAQRVREIGIRTALGAERRDIMRMILRDGLKVIGIGTALGGLLAFAAIKLTSAKVVALPSADLVTVAAAPAILAAAMLLATYIPARRAARVDPMIALRRL